MRAGPVSAGSLPMARTPRMARASSRLMGWPARRRRAWAPRQPPTASHARWPARRPGRPTARGSQVMASHRRPGAGSVRRLPSGRWQARRTEADGSMRSLGTWLTHAEAERALAAAELDDLAGSRILDDGGTVGEWADRWLARSVHWKSTTRAGHEQVLRAGALPRWGNVELSAITRSHVEAWVAEMIAGGAQPDAIRLALVPRRAICRLAVAEGALAIDPTAGVRHPRLPKRMLTVRTAAQVETRAREIEQPDPGHPGPIRPPVPGPRRCAYRRARRDDPVRHC